MRLRLPLLLALLLSTLLLAAGAAHGAPAFPSLQVLAGEEEPLEAEIEEEGPTECDSAYEEADEGILSEAEAEQICEEEDDESQSAAKPSRGDKGGHHAHGNKRACRRKPHARKRQCRRDRQGGGSDSRARGGATGQAGRRTPTSE